MGNLKEFWMTQIQQFDVKSTVEQMEKWKSQQTSKVIKGTKLAQEADSANAAKKITCIITKVYRIKTISRIAKMKQWTETVKILLREPRSLKKCFLSMFGKKQDG